MARRSIRLVQPTEVRGDHPWAVPNLIRLDGITGPRYCLGHDAAAKDPLGGFSWAVPAGVFARVYNGTATELDMSYRWYLFLLPNDPRLYAAKQEDIGAIEGSNPSVYRVAYCCDQEEILPLAFAGGPRNRTMHSLYDPSGFPFSWPNQNTLPPAGWEQPAFDDSSWADAVVASRDLPLPPYATRAWWTTVSPRSNTEHGLGRFTFPWSGPAPARASDVVFQIKCDDAVYGFYLNGHPMWVAPYPVHVPAIDPANERPGDYYQFDQPEYRVVVLPNLLWLNTAPGASNIVAIGAVNIHPSHAWVSWGLNLIPGADNQP